MSWFASKSPRGHHIDPATGRNRRDNLHRHHDDGDYSQSPKRWGGRIVDRKESADKMKIERAMRRRSR